MTEYKFSEGCMWEGGEWTIFTNCECESTGGGEPCKHCTDISVKEHTHNGHKWTTKVWICPAVVIAKNEGGCDSTGMCLQCIIEAADSIKGER